MNMAWFVCISVEWYSKGTACCLWNCVPCNSEGRAWTLHVMCKLAWYVLARERHALCELIWNIFARDRHVICELAWHGFSKGTAWKQHAICELEWRCIAREPYCMCLLLWHGVEMERNLHGMVCVNFCCMV